MGIQVPKQLQDEIKQAVPHLRLIIPAVAAVGWVFGKLFGHRKPKLEEHVEVEEEGEIIEVELPALGRGPKLPFTAPRPLHNVLLEATFPVSINSLWSYLLSGKSSELIEFHRSLGEHEISLSPWRKKSNGQRVRVLQFSTPLKNPLGPKQAFNREDLVLGHLSANAFVINTTATSKGVPFANNFKNHVQWVAVEQGPAITKLTITGECIFVTPVWGPLKGTINKESIRGMGRAYKVLETILADNFGILSSRTPGSTYVTKTGAEKSLSFSDIGANGDDTNVLAYLMQSPQTNPAVLVALLAMIIIMWRMAMLNNLTMQIFQRLAVAKA